MVQVTAAEDRQSACTIKHMTGLGIVPVMTGDGQYVGSPLIAKHAQFADARFSYTVLP
jgi:hypothetical protein